MISCNIWRLEYVKVQFQKKIDSIIYKKFDIIYNWELNLYFFN